MERMISEIMQSSFERMSCRTITFRNGTIFVNYSECGRYAQTISTLLNRLARVYKHLRLQKLDPDYSKRNVWRSVRKLGASCHPLRLSYLSSSRDLRVSDSYAIVPRQRV